MEEEHHSIECCGRWWSQLRYRPSVLMAGSNEEDYLEWHHGEFPSVNETQMRVELPICSFADFVRYLREHPDSMAEFKNLLNPPKP